MTTQTDTAPLSAEELAKLARSRSYTGALDDLPRKPEHWTNELVLRLAADALDALSARVKEMEALNSSVVANGVDNIAGAALDERDEEIERLTKRVESLENSRSCAIADHVAAEARATQAEAERDAFEKRYLEEEVRAGDAEGDVFALREDLQATRAALSASQAREAGMREALSKPGKLVYLDGRTDDAAHVVPFPMQTADIDTDRDLTESADAIYDEAAKLGYGDGCAVWCEFSRFPGQYGDFGMCEIAPGWEFVGIDPLLTEMFGGRPPEEDDAALSPAQPAQDRIAAAVAFIDRNGPTPGADRFEGPEVTGPAQGADIARDLAEELQATSDILSIFVRESSDPGADAMCALHRHGILIRRARRAGLLTTETEGSK